MKNKIIICMLFVFSIIILSGCNQTDVINNGVYDNVIDDSLFVTVQVCSNYSIVYHKDTKVMYAVSKSTYNCGNFTLLVDTEGLPLLFKEY